jgi:glycosyltransferase involved in cell wall biosynthesis
MSRWTIYFWEPCISPHKLALFRALLDHGRVDHCVYVTQEIMLAERLTQGWPIEPVDDLDVRVGPTEDEVRRIIAEAPANALHLFSCVHWVPCVVQGIRAAVDANARFAIMAEPRVREGVKGLMRLAHSWVTERHVRRNADFVLAIGRNGPSWFRRTGYRRDRIFPFAYFLPISSDPDAGAVRDVPKIGYLGRLIKPKGFDLFLEAMPLLRQPASIAIAGSGDRAEAIEALSHQMPGKVDFRGTIAMADVPSFLADIDILVLPSITTDDGWGAVVSEALMAGAAVVATHKVGASICLDADWRGAVSFSLQPRDLAKLIDAVIAHDGLMVDTQRQCRRVWANEHLSGRAGAAYLMAVLDHIHDGGARPAAFYEDLHEVDGG